MFTPLDYQWMKRALALAQMAAEQQEVPVGAVLVRADQVLGEGFNASITRCDATAHAEIQALRQASEREGNYRLPDTCLYVTIEPCAMCAAALVHARVSRVIFGAPEPKAGAAGSAMDFFSQPFLNHRVSVSGGCMEAESRALIQAFFAQRRAKKKALKHQK